MRWLSLLPLLVASLVVVGCPPRQTRIALSDSGAAQLISTCNTGVGTLAVAEQSCRDLVEQCLTVPCDLSCGALEGICDGIDLLSLTLEQCESFGASCRTETQSCDNVPTAICNDIESSCVDDVATFDEVCGVPDLDVPPLEPGVRASIGTQIVLTRGIGSAALVASRCGVADVDGADVATGLNTAIEKALGSDGLQHDEVDEPEDALPLMLLFHDRDGDGVTCAREELFACAALGRRAPSEDSYDVLCGSCQKGLLPAVPTAPCNQQCILPYCLSLLP